MSQTRVLPCILGLAGWLFLSFAAATVGSLVSPGDWYAGLIWITFAAALNFAIWQLNA